MAGAERIVKGIRKAAKMGIWSSHPTPLPELHYASTLVAAESKRLPTPQTVHLAVGDILLAAQAAMERVAIVMIGATGVQAEAVPALSLQTVAAPFSLRQLVALAAGVPTGMGIARILMAVREGAAAELVATAAEYPCLAETDK